MQRNFEKRINPAQLLKGARSVICVGLNYTPPKNSHSSPSNAPHPRSAAPTGKVTSYAQYEDYHLFVTRQLRELVDFIISIVGAGFRFKICVDSAPVAERGLAARAGLGFIGKNHMLVNPEFGLQIFLGEIINNLELQTSSEDIQARPAECSSCDKCIKACPTGALRADGRFDASRCISYLTIEYKGEIPPSLAEKIGDRLFGCDECILACSYQKSAPVCKNKQFKFRAGTAEFNLRDILDLTEDAFEEKFSDSPVKRLGLAGLKRNARICLTNIARPR